MAEKLYRYFESEPHQRQALAGVVSGGWLSAGENLDLYEASRHAFYESRSADESFRSFEKIYDELKGRNWQVFRPNSPAVCWPPRRIFETIQREFADFAWGGSVNLLNFSQGNEADLYSRLDSMRTIKPKQGYPLMTVSKFLHFYNPSLFPIYDNAVMWEQVIHGRFKDDFREFCDKSKVLYDRAIEDETALFLIHYIRWANSLLSMAHGRFMAVFVEWLNAQPGASLSARSFDPRTLHAMAFEFTAIGALSAESSAVASDESTGNLDTFSRMITLPTWGGLSEFRYEGSIAQGTWISWKDKSKSTGWSKPEFMKAGEYQMLLSHFAGQEVSLGNYRNPERGTMEDWLKGIGQLGLANYIGPILLREGYAERGTGRGRIVFKTAKVKSVGS